MTKETMKKSNIKYLFYNIGIFL